MRGVEGDGLSRDSSLRMTHRAFVVVPVASGQARPSSLFCSPAWP